MAYFGESLTDYFALDDVLEPALAVICEVLRGSEDFGAVLEKRSSSFIGLAQAFQKFRSPNDHDYEMRTLSTFGRR